MILLLEFSSNWLNVWERVWPALEAFPLCKQAAVGELAVAVEAAPCKLGFPTQHSGAGWQRGLFNCSWERLQAPIEKSLQRVAAGTAGSSGWV